MEAGDPRAVGQGPGSIVSPLIGGILACAPGLKKKVSAKMIIEKDRKKYLGNEEVLSGFREWWGPSRGILSEEMLKGGIAAIKTFAEGIDPVPLAECTVAELNMFEKEMLKTHDRAALRGIGAFRSYRESVLKAGRNVETIGRVKLRNVRSVS